MSEQYLVSARKYRPQLFDTVVGQSHVTTTLKNAIRQQQLAHAFLFCGPRGVGKTTCARILAKTINCENPTADIEACGQCSTCKSFDAQSSFNVFELDAASNNSVDDIRELVNQVRFAPQHGRYKIYIIDEVHMLSASAFNAFLKTLEEPPPYAIFILATTEKHKILPTILSRCQIFDFKRISTKNVVDHLGKIAEQEQVQADEEALHMIAVKSEGCMRDALSMFDRIVSFTDGELTYSHALEHLNLLDAEFYFQLGDLLLAKDVPGTMILLDDILDKGFEGNVVLEGLAEHYRNILLCKEVRMAELLDVPQAHKRIYFEKALLTPASFLLNALQTINESVLNYRNNNNKRLHTEVCLLRLCFLNELSAAPVEEKKKITEPANLTSLPKASNAASGPVAAKDPPPRSDDPRSSPEDTIQRKEQSESALQAEPSARKNEISIANKSNITREVLKPSSSAIKKNPFGREVKAGEGSRLTDLQKRIKEQAIQQTQEYIELTADKTLEIFAQYLEDVKIAGNKSSYLALLQSVQMQTKPPDTIQLICNDSFAESYIKTQKNDLMDFFHTKMQRRVMIEIEVQQNVNEEPAKYVLSKQEIFNKMLEENGVLRALHAQYHFSVG